MSTMSTRRRSLLAMAGVTAGLTSVLAPSAAQAQPDAPPRSDLSPLGSDTATRAQVTAAQAATCSSFTVVPQPDGTNVAFPSVTRDGQDYLCELARGNSGDGVFKLQDALIRCYGQNIARDKIYGPATEQAVRNVQNFHALTVDGRYGPETAYAMLWPFYRPDGSYYCAT